jgi:hypothetical protein
MTMTRVSNKGTDLNDFETVFTGYLEAKNKKECYAT